MYVELKDDGKTVNCYKPSVCEWCAEKIKSREQAIVRNYIWEDCLNYEHMHPECYTAMQESNELDEWTFGMFNRGQTYEEYENE